MDRPLPSLAGPGHGSAWCGRGSAMGGGTQERTGTPALRAVIFDGVGTPATSMDTAFPVGLRAW